MVFGASHGFMEQGFQALVTNRYDVMGDYYELILVERYLRSASEKHSNIYNLAHYAACRENLTQQDKHKLIKLIHKPEPV